MVKVKASKSKKFKDDKEISELVNKIENKLKNFENTSSLKKQLDLDE